MKTKLLLTLALWVFSRVLAVAAASITFTNPTPAASDLFGNAVAAVGADKVLIAAYYDDTGATDAGAAYLFSTNGTLLTTFTNPTPAAADLFGNAVAAIGVDKVLIAAYRDDTGTTDTGAAYLFSINGTLLTIFTNPTPVASDNFGCAVAALSTNKVLIGADFDDTGAVNAGAAYLFSTNGTLLTTFTNPAPTTSAHFGNAVTAVGSDRVLIGAYWDDTGANNAGAAYLFSTNGALLFTYTNPAPAASDLFGSAVAAVGTDKVLISAYADDTGATNAGAAYLFSTNGTLLTTFTNPTPADSDWFGYALSAVGPDKVLIGAYQDDTGALNAGAAYLFSLNGTLLATFTKTNLATYDSFGSAVAAVGTDKVLIGAFQDNIGAGDAGAAYLFSLGPHVFTLSASLVTEHSATLNGTVNPQGLDTVGWFEWGTTTNYGSTSLPTSVGSGSSNAPVSNTVTGLTAGVTYHFRAVAANPEGTTYGTDLTFVAADWVITTLTDGGPGSLREAIASISSGKTIGFSVAGTIILTNQLMVTNNLTIAGPGATNLAISGNHNSRVFSIASTTAVVCISGLTICDGTWTGSITTGGAGVFNIGRLTVEDCRITSNTNNSSAGGGIYNDADSGELKLNRCCIDQNSAHGGGGIFNIGLLTVVNCTISGNSTKNGPGGGIYSESDGLEIFDSTICSNSAMIPGGGNGGWGGGVFFTGDVGNHVANTIIANNAAIYVSTSDFRNGFVSYGHNLIGNSSGGTIYEDPHNRNTFDLLDFDPRLGPLAYNGGPTPTHALLFRSPALEAGDDDMLHGFNQTVDQRGYPRKAGFHVDIGAVEMTNPGIVTPSAEMMSLVGVFTNLVSGTLTAVLNAPVFSGGAAFVKASLEFGWTTNYGGVAGYTNFLVQSDPTVLNIPVSGLAQGARFYCRIVATNVVGTTIGSNQLLVLPSLTAPGDLNGDGVVSQSELDQVLSNYWPASPWLYLTNLASLGGTTVTFELSNSTAGGYSVLMSTNLVDWEYLGPATPRYEFTDTNAPALPERFYRLRWP